MEVEQHRIKQILLNSIENYAIMPAHFQKGNFLSCFLTASTAIIESSYGN